MTPDGDDRALEHGAYGLGITGLGGVENLLVRADPTWPRLEIVARRGTLGGLRNHVDDDRATIVLLGGVAAVKRSPARAVFTFDGEPNLAAVVHPYMAPVAGLFSHWHGRDSIHAGAFVVEGGAWGLLSDRGGGKSTTLARLALEGLPIVTDDVLVIERERVFAGPRAIDLRRDPATALGVGVSLGALGTRERWRVTLEQCGGSFPLRGWVFLSWGNELSLESVAAGERFKRLVEARTIRLSPQNPADLLRLAARPAFELRRPRDWSSLEDTVRLLLGSLP